MAAPIVVLMVVTAACGSGDGASTAPDATETSAVPTAPATTVAPPTTTTASTSTAPMTTAPMTTAPTSSQPIGLDDADRAAITAVFATFFGGATTSVDEKVAVLQDGETYREMLTDASENEQFQQMSTDIREIRAGTDAECAAQDAGAGCAIVAHDVLVAGFPMAAGIESPAIRGGDGWLVGARAWCDLVESGGEVCPTPDPVE